MNFLFFLVFGGVVIVATADPISNDARAICGTMIVVAAMICIYIKEAR